MKYLIVIGLGIIASLSSCQKEELEVVPSETVQHATQEPVYINRDLRTGDDDDEPFLIRGTVTGINSNPINGVGFSLTQLSSGNEYSNTTSNGNGIYELDSVVAGDYVLDIRKPGYHSILDTLSISSDMVDRDYTLITE